MKDFSRLNLSVLQKICGWWRPLHPLFYFLCYIHFSLSVGLTMTMNLSQIDDGLIAIIPSVLTQDK